MILGKCTPKSRVPRGLPRHLGGKLEEEELSKIPG